MKHAIIYDGSVLRVQDLDENEVQNVARHSQAVIDVTNANPMPEAGWTFDGLNFVAPEGVVPSRKITRLAFRNRLTQTEKASIYAIASQNNGLGFLMRSYLDDLSAATFVDLARPDTIASMNQLTALTILTAERAQEILNSPIQEIERFKE